MASRHPPIDLFERVSADPAIWDALIAAAARVDPGIRTEMGEIRLVPPEERISGPGASYVMAAFTHLNPKGSRFSDGSYGIYYAGRQFRTALRETSHHFARFAADSEDGPRYEDMRVLVGRINGRLHDVARLPSSERARILDPASSPPANCSRPRSGTPEAMVWSIPACATLAGNAPRPFVQRWSASRRESGT